jgi:hypothetical protein
VTISPLALQAKRVIENAWLHGAAYDLASQAAFALESAQLLQSPETAAQSAVSADAVRVAEESVAELRREHEENARLRARIAELEAERKETGSAMPWAHAMSDHDLHGFLDDLVSAAMGRWQSEPEVQDRTVLANVERVCAAWWRPGQGNRLDGSEFDGVTVQIAPGQALREVPDGEHYAAVHHDYRQGRSMPELGGV